LQSVSRKSHIHYESFSYLHTETQVSFALIAAMLRLGTKYDMKSLREEAIAYLSAECPSTLKAWDEDNSHFDHYDGVLFDLVNLAREYALLVLLPALFLWTALFHDSSKICGGFRRANGSLAIMPVEDQIRCIVGLHQICCAQMRHLFRLMNLQSPSCDARQRCAIEKEKLFEDLKLEFREARDRHEMFGLLE
jgi:hypothetical protein